MVVGVCFFMISSSADLLFVRSRDLLLCAVLGLCALGLPVLGSDRNLVDDLVFDLVDVDLLDALDRLRTLLAEIRKRRVVTSVFVPRLAEPRERNPVFCLESRVL